MSYTVGEVDRLSGRRFACVDPENGTTLCQWVGVELLRLSHFGLHVAISGAKRMNENLFHSRSCAVNRSFPMISVEN